MLGSDSGTAESLKVVDMVPVLRGIVFESPDMIADFVRFVLK